MSWQLLPGDLIVLLGQYLCYQDRFAWAGICKRFWAYRSGIMRPSEELISRAYGWHYMSARKMLADAFSLLIWRDMPTIRCFFDETIPDHFMYPPYSVCVYSWFREHFDLIMSSPIFRDYFLNPHRKSQRIYRASLINENTHRWRSNSDLPVYLDAMNWQLVLENWCRHLCLEPHNEEPDKHSWHCRNMSMMNYLYLQTYIDPNVDPVIARIIKRHYRPTQEQIYKAVRVYITGNFHPNYQQEWENLLHLLLRQFPIPKPYQQRVKRVCRRVKAKHWRPTLPVGLFPFEL